MLLKTKKYAEALKQSSSAMDRYPLSRGIRKQYATALINSGDYKKAERYLRDQLQLYRSDPALHSQLAWVYDKQNKKALMHMSLAESYALQGSLPAALQQLRMARLSPDATFYDHSIIDAREREWKALHQAQVKEKNKF